MSSPPSGQNYPLPKVDTKANPLDGNFEYISPTIAAGAAAFDTLLARRAAVDQLMVNGYDVLHLNNNIIGALVAKKVLTAGEASQLAEISKPISRYGYSRSRSPDR